MINVYSCEMITMIKIMNISITTISFPKGFHPLYLLLLSPGNHWCAWCHYRFNLHILKFMWIESYSMCSFLPVFNSALVFWNASMLLYQYFIPSHCWIVLYKCYAICLLICPSMDICFFFSNFWLLQIKLLWTFGFICFHSSWVTI